ncbi:MAG: hypothetical protein KIT09_02790 [Bryobacteraceae bacterium]|nr:hypothetical protein [Bryobacteraceae bacterium]
MAFNEETDKRSGTAAEDQGEGSVLDSARHAATQAKEAAAGAAGKVRRQAASRADRQREHVASGFSSVAGALRRMGDDLREEEYGFVARYAASLGESVGDRVDRLGRYLRENDIDRLMQDAEAFARRRPAVFLGGAFLIGFATSRFLGSSRNASVERVHHPMAATPDPSYALPPASGGPGVSSSPAYGGSVRDVPPGGLEPSGV